MFQDDLTDTSDNLANARESNRKVNVLVKQHYLNLNRDKSVYILVGSKKQKEEARKELGESPLMCGDFQMKEENVSKYLGQYLSSKGLAASVMETVQKRDGKIRGAALEIAQIVNDWRSHLAGGMMTAVTMLERCCNNKKVKCNPTVVLALDISGRTGGPPGFPILGPNLPRYGRPRDGAEGAAGPAPAPPGPGVPGRQGVPRAAGQGLAGPRVRGAGDLQRAQY